MVLKHYIYRELAWKLVWTLGLLILILSSDKLARFLSDAAAGKLPGDMVITMLGYKILATLPKILPVTLLFTVLLTFARMARDRELVVLSAAGMGRRFQIMITLRFALGYALFVALIGIYLAPWAEVKIELLKEKVRREADVSGITAGQFKEFSGGKQVIYVEKFADDKQTMQNVFLRLNKNDKLTILKAAGARLERYRDTEDRFILFENGRHYFGQPGLIDYQITEYQTYAVLLEQNEVEARRTDVESLPFSALWGSNVPEHGAEMHWRLGLIISSVLLALFAVLLSPFLLGEKIFIPFVATVLVYLIYSNLLSVGTNLIQRDLVPSYIGLWWAHLLFLGGMAGLYYFPLIGYRRKRQP